MLRLGFPHRSSLALGLGLAVLALPQQLVLALEYSLPIQARKQPEVQRLLQ
jgi:hypothetical protein